MDQCKEYNSSDLFNYVYDVLDKRARIKIENHLKQCFFCKQRVNKISGVKLVLKDTPKFIFKESVDSIIKTAEEKKQKAGLIIHGIIKSLKNILRGMFPFKKFKMKLAYTLLCGILLLTIASLLILNSKSKTVYFTRVQGDVFINNKPFFPDKQYKYDIKNPVIIKVQNGECVLQIKNEKLIIIKQNSEIVLKKKRNEILKLIKGKIICMVNKTEGDKLIISADDVKFKIVGTKFFVNKQDAFIECGVKQGEILTTLKNETLIITNNSLFVKKDDEILLTKLLKNKLTCFNNLDRNFINDFSGIREVSIKGIPHNSHVYYEYNIIGETPLFFLSSLKKGDDLFIVKEGFIPLNVKLMKKDYKLDFKLNKLKMPELLQKYKLPSQVFLRPVKIKDYLIIPALNGMVYKFDLKKNKIIWEFKTKNRISTTPIYHKNILYFTSNDKFFYAVDFMSGELIWKKKVGTLVYSIPFIYNQKIYFGNTSGILYCLNLRDGSIIWTKKFNKGFYSSLIVKDNILYIGNSSGVFYAINIINKNILWKFKTHNRIFSSKSVIKNNLLYFGSNDRFIYAVNYKSGSLKWRYKTDSEILTSPICIDGIIIIASSKGMIYALDYNDGLLKWRYKAKGKIIIDPVLVNNEFISFGDKKNNLYLLNKYGLLFSKFKYNFNIYTISKNSMFIFSRNKKVTVLDI